MKKTLHINVQPPFFDDLLTGKKTIEVRLAKPKFFTLEKGDSLLVNDEILLEIIDVRRYPSFKELLTKEPFEKIFPRLNEIEEGLEVLAKFYSNDEEKTFSTMAIEVKKMNPNDR